MRRFPILLAVALSLAGCTASSQEVLPVAPSIKSASFVRGTEIILGQRAAASAPALDEQAEGRTGLAALPFETLLGRMIEEVTQEAGLVSGRPLKLIVEIDDLAVANTGSAFFGAKDQLAGSVFIRDAETGEELGQLYIKVGGSNAGLLGILTRGGGVRERLAEAFARRIANSLEGGSPKTR